jgi:hypothetical protein
VWGSFVLCHVCLNGKQQLPTTLWIPWVKKIPIQCMISEWLEFQQLAVSK